MTFDFDFDFDFGFDLGLMYGGALLCSLKIVGNDDLK